jgi:hypothetical protein
MKKKSIIDLVDQKPGNKIDLKELQLKIVGEDHPERGVDNGVNKIISDSVDKNTVVVLEFFRKDQKFGNKNAQEIINNFIETYHDQKDQESWKELSLLCALLNNENIRRIDGDESSSLEQKENEQTEIFKEIDFGFFEIIRNCAEKGAKVLCGETVEGFNERNGNNNNNIKNNDIGILEYTISKNIEEYIGQEQKDLNKKILILCGNTHVAGTSKTPPIQEYFKNYCYKKGEESIFICDNKNVFSDNHHNIPQDQILAIEENNFAIKEGWQNKLKDAMLSELYKLYKPKNQKVRNSALAKEGGINPFIF